MDRREQLLLELLSPRRPIKLISGELSKFRWDCDAELVTLERSHLKSLLGNFVAGQLTAADVHMWAETVEGRDDIGLEAECTEQLKSIIFELATPTINRPLSPALAKLFIDETSRLDNRLPRPASLTALPHHPVQRRQRLGGMLSYYLRAAA